jgi:glutamyl-tRNA(Gln) amidotransferase subunit E
MKDSGLVRRGIGTVREDVNVSINGGTRVEIKGVHKVGNIEPLTAIEAFRQKRLLELKKIFTERFPDPEKIDYKEDNITWLFNGTLNEISRRLESDRPHKAVALHLPQIVDIINYKLQPGRDFGFELSGRVRVIACIDSKPNLFFYSQRQKYDIPEQIWNRLEQEYHATVKDDIVIVCGPSADVATAISEIKIRIGELAVGVINETRQDLKDGTTDFERILPGPDRMYPDTDHPPVKITETRVAELRKNIGEPLWTKQERWRQIPLSESLVHALSLSPFQSVFEKLFADNSINPSMAAHICAELTVGLRRAGYDLTKVSYTVLYDLIHTALKRNWPYRRLKSDLIKVADGAEWTEGPDFELTDEDFEKIYDDACASFNCRSNSATHDKLRRYVTGRILQKFTNTKNALEKINTRMAAS